MPGYLVPDEVSVGTSAHLREEGVSLALVLGFTGTDEDGEPFDMEFHLTPETAKQVGEHIVREHP